jgi:hypothetical protein
MEDNMRFVQNKIFESLKDKISNLAETAKAEDAEIKELNEKEEIKEDVDSN